MVDTAKKKLKKVSLEKKKQKSISKWIIHAAWFYLLFSISIDIIARTEGTYFIIFIPLIRAAIGFACGYQCSFWAKKIDKSMNWAFVIGYMFNLIGLLIYFLYYNYQKKFLDNFNITKTKQNSKN